MYDSVPTMMQQLVEINTSLANAASRLWDLSIAIEAHHTPTNTLYPGLYDCLNSSLRLLDHTLNEKLLPARLALAKAHSQSIGSIMSLPDEILSSIFVSAVYDPNDKKYPFPATDMHTHLCQIYRRVHSLLEVCTRWRNVGIACSRLWKIIPLSIAPDGSRRLLSTELSLQRARGDNLHLVAISPCPLPYFSEKLAGHWHRLSNLNIWSDHSSPTVIRDILNLLIQHGAPRSISKLSLIWSPWPWESSDPQSQSSLHAQLAQSEPQFSQLLHSLAVLRICKVRMNWARVNFSECLVELWISNIKLHGSSTITGFLDMLSSAHGVRDLAILSMDMTLQEGEIFPSRMVSLSQLESLHLDSLSLNCLRVLLSAILPGAYYTTLGLREDTTYHNSTYDEFVQQDFALLKARKIDRLIVSPTGSAPWDSTPGLRLLLESVPKATSLAIGFYRFHANLIKALTPTEPGNDAVSSNETFPRLQTLEFFAFESRSPLSHLLEEFKTLVRGHAIRRLIIECNVSSAQDADDEEDELVHWLKVNIPEFYTCSCSYENPVGISEWRLWDV
ncbi:Chaoptin [Rhizoctonia solani]|uniref:Chaoptin n=1 Tax=Rhizoctonia solani TaxID=456999 RepID=A0A0K6GIS5_9AGAM|nr:Chaoptin [Rhizoctonia solani]